MPVLPDPLDRSRRLSEILAQTVSGTVGCARLTKKKPRPIEQIRNIHSAWASRVLSLLNLGIDVTGTPSVEPTLFVANHVSYLDIVVLMQILDPKNLICFVSKKEVAAWPVFGAATTAAETIYVDRKLARTGVDVRRQMAEQIRDRFERGLSVVIFPEGTSSIDVKAFKAGPFQTAFEQKLLVQPVTIAYSPLRDVAYIDNDTLLPHLWRLLGHAELKAQVHFHTPRRVEDVDSERVKTHQEVQAKFRELIGKQS